MNITLYVNSSEKNKIGKALTTVDVLQGSIKGESSIINPTILIEYDNPTAFNYVYIDAFSRYYFVNDVIVVRNGLLRVSLTVDVLESFAAAILSQNVIIDKNTTDFDLYLPDENLLTLVKTKTDIINFPSGLLESGEFILITVSRGNYSLMLLTIGMAGVLTACNINKSCKCLIAAIILWKKWKVYCKKYPSLSLVIIVRVN